MYNNLLCINIKIEQDTLEKREYNYRITRGKRGSFLTPRPGLGKHRPLHQVQDGVVKIDIYYTENWKYEN